MAEVKVSIDGMGCQHCVDAVKKALGTVSGVQSFDVEVGSASVAYDDSATSVSDIETAIINAGYKIKK